MDEKLKAAGERLLAVIKACGMSQKEFAGKIGVTPAAISAVCNGKNGASATTVKMICSTFEVSERWLVDGEGEMFEPKTSYDEIADFVADLSKKEPDDFQVRLMRGLARLSPEKWSLLEEIFKDVTEEL